jgi:hypothetical protein
LEKNIPRIQVSHVVETGIRFNFKELMLFENTCGDRGPMHDVAKSQERIADHVMLGLEQPVSSRRYRNVVTS